VRKLLALFASGGFLSVSASAVVAACAHGSPEAAADAAGELADAPVAVVDAPADVAEPVVDAGRGNLAPLGATAQTSVVDQPWWPETGKGSRRLGYLRHGAVVTAYDRAVVNDDCKDGWYELETGGYVCGKASTFELTSPKIRLAPHQPDRTAGMPYRYGVNLTDGTPLYRRVLGAEDRKKYEPWLAPPKNEEREEKEDKAERPERSEETPTGSSDEESASAAPTPTPAKKKEREPTDAGVDASKPKLKELRGRGVLVRKMARGFYLALDKEFKAGGARWWRTSFGFAVPHERIMLQTSVTKHGGTWFTAAADDAGAGAQDAGSDAGAVLWAGAEAGALADAAPSGGPGVVGFVDVGFARKLELSEDGKKVVWGPELPKRSAVMLDGVTAVAAGQTYHHTSSGFWVRLADLKLARPQPPADLRPDEKWIDVDLTRQALVAFEGLRPVFATLISSGRRNPQDKEKDFPTPTGTFHIREKHVTTTMDGDVASDGPYSIEDVPWVMYFQGSYALHGAFWHDSFGRMRSHGCVNMAPDDARTLFAWADPQLPPGWHGVFAKDEASGTRVVVHEDVPEKRRR